MRSPRYPPVFTPRQARPRGIAHHNGATPDATCDRGAPRTRTADAAPRLSNIVPPRVTNVQSALHKKINTAVNREVFLDKLISNKDMADLTATTRQLVAETFKSSLVH